MQNILVLGAGQSATFLIQYLLDHAVDHDWYVTVGDCDGELAARAVGGHPRGVPVAFDVNDGLARENHVERADVVVHLLPPRFQSLLAWDCVRHGTHLVSASYRSKAVREMETDIVRQGVLVLCEVGLDPGIDHMSAMSLIHRVHDAGGVIESFESYGGGVAAPDEGNGNPLRYWITWNPRNVVMAAEYGAQFLEGGKIKIVPWHSVFQHTWSIDVDGVGPMEAYPNRDSLAYRELYGLEQTKTFVRGTLRYPGWSETWDQIVRLGLPHEHIHIPNMAECSWAEMVEMFVPSSVPGAELEHRVANLLHISPTGRVMENLRWLGLFSNELIGIDGGTAAQAMIHLLRSRLALVEGARDMVILLHRLGVHYPEDDGRRETLTSTMTSIGAPGGTTAMARTVGLPAGVAVRLLLEERLPLTGCHIPTHPMVYQPVLEELEAEGLGFVERSTAVAQ